MKVPWSHSLLRSAGEREEIVEQKNFAVKFRGLRWVQDLAFVKLLWGSVWNNDAP